MSPEILRAAAESLRVISIDLDDLAKLFDAIEAETEAQEVQDEVEHLLALANDYDERARNL